MCRPFARCLVVLSFSLATLLVKQSISVGARASRRRRGKPFVSGDDHISNSFDQLARALSALFFRSCQYLSIHRSGYQSEREMPIPVILSQKMRPNRHFLFPMPSCQGNKIIVFFWKKKREKELN
jgi:hypothetical protein